MLFPARRFKKESLGRDCFFVKIVKKLGGCQGNHYLCIIIKEFVYENRAAVIAECEIVWQ